MHPLATLVELLGRHAATDGTHATAIPGVSLVRASEPTLPMPVVYEPTLCLVAQGRKRALLGSTSYVYDAARYLIASVDLPVTGSVIEASAEQPYLCLVFDLDMAQLSELALRHPAPESGGTPPPRGIGLEKTTSQLLEAAVRLAALMDTPADIAELAPLVQREIHYRLLTGPGNGLVRQMAQANSHLNQIARAIAWLRGRYAQHWSIDDLAQVAGMSRSSFHAHFKAVTAMSPLEFRKQLRLQEARRLMVAEALDAASAGFQVGYESPSQFSRDYGRAFGMSPAKDAQRLRSGAA